MFKAGFVLILNTLAVAIAAAGPGGARVPEFDRGPVPTGGLVFHASFDHGPAADAGIGFPEMHYGGYFRANQNWQFSFIDGKFGKALDLGRQRQETEVYKKAFREFAAFKLHGHACLRVGTLSFWFRDGAKLPRVELDSQTNDRFFDLEFLAASAAKPGEDLRATFVQRDYRRTDPITLAPAAATDDVWHHVALVWDDAIGAKAYLDGAEVKNAGAAASFHSGYLSLGRIGLENATIDELRIYDVALDGEQVAALVRGEQPSTGGASVDTVPQEHRLEQLGWNGAPDGQFIAVNGPTLIRKLDIANARALRMSGWRGVDGRDDSVWPLRYHGYDYFNGGALHLQFPDEAAFNYVRVTGRMDQADLCIGDAWERPADAPVIASLTGERYITGFTLPEPVSAAAVSVYPKQPKAYYQTNFKELGDLAFYDVQPTHPSGGSSMTYFHLSDKAPETVAGAHRVRLVGWYRPDERRVITAATERASGGAPIDVQPLRFVHLMTAPQPNDTAMDAVRIQLRSEGWKTGNLVNLRVHDPFNLWRNLADVDVRVETDGALDVTLAFPPTILPKDTELWVSLVSRDGGKILPGEGSSLAIRSPDMKVATESYLTWQHRLLKDTFAFYSEPRPWAFNTFDDDFLRVGLTPYDAIARIVWDLHRRFPEDRRTRGYMLFTHPRATDYWDALPIDLPRDPAVPRWALLEKELLHEFLYYANWWVDNRMMPNGEYGNFYGDDTDLVLDWVSLSMIHDPQGKLRGAVRTLADHVWKDKIRNGLNIKHTDALHAYEEGLNVQPAAALLDYGNPVLINRLLETARRYDGHLLSDPVDGKRVLKGGFFSDGKVDGKLPPPRYGVLALHAGMMLTWYNGSPHLTKLLSEYHEGTAAPPESIANLSHLLYQQTGDQRFIVSAGPPEADPNWARILQSRSLDPAVKQGLVDFRYGYSRDLGWANYSPLRKYVLWHHTRDKNDLVPALEGLWKQTYYTIGLYTETEQSGDRVAVHKNLTDFMYLGGIPAARNHLVPRVAVSYEGFSENLAALVVDDSATELRWVGFNFEDQPQKGTLRVWNLEPGRYEVRTGIDADGDDRIDEVTETRSMDLIRHEPVEVTLPSKRLYIVEARQLERRKPLVERCDLAVSHEEAVRKSGNLEVLVHNLGCAPTGAFKVDITDAAGKVLASKDHPGLEGLAELQARSVRLAFEGLPGNDVLKVMLKTTAEEITTVNNAATLDPS